MGGGRKEPERLMWEVALHELQPGPRKETASAGGEFVVEKR